MPDVGLLAASPAPPSSSARFLSPAPEPALRPCGRRSERQRVESREHGTRPVSLLLAPLGQVRQRPVETLALSLAREWHSCGTRADTMGDSVSAFEKYRGHKLGAGAQNAVPNLYLSSSVLRLCRWEAVSARSTRLSSLGLPELAPGVWSVPPAQEETGVGQIAVPRDIHSKAASR